MNIDKMLAELRAEREQSNKRSWCLNDWPRDKARDGDGRQSGWRNPKDASDHREKEQAELTGS